MYSSFQISTRKSKRNVASDQENVYTAAETKAHAVHAQDSRRRKSEIFATVMTMTRATWIM